MNAVELCFKQVQISNALQLPEGEGGEDMSQEMNQICPHCYAPLAAHSIACTACGTQAESQNPYGTLPYGTQIAQQYVLGAFVSVDGEGIIYQAVDKLSHRKVQIKEYLPITLSEDRSADGTVNPKQGSGVMFKTTRMDFADLYRALQNITPAKGLHHVLDVVEDYNTAYAVLGLLEGIPLSGYLKDLPEGKLSAASACKLLTPVVEGLEAMHAVGLVHRGISPENILILPSGEICLTGYATIGLRTIGTALRPQVYEGYSAPEQYATAEFEGRYTDVYCLAAVYYYLVTGQAPISAGQRLVVDANPSARSLCANVPRYFSDVLAYALRMRPAERMQTVSALAHQLASQQAAEELLLAAKREKKKKAQRGFTGVLGRSLIACFALACLAAVGFLSCQGRGSEGDVNPDPTPTVAPTPTPEPIYVDKFEGLLYSQLISTTVYNDKYLFYVVEERYSDAVAGTVLSQIPAAGERLGDDVTVQLVVSKGPEMVVIPQVFGFTQESAAAELENVGLAASFVMKVNDGSYASGCVIKTAPEAGTQVQAGSIVTVYIAADRDVSVIHAPE